MMRIKVSSMRAMSGTKKPMTILTQKKTRPIMKMNNNFNCKFFPLFKANIRNIYFLPIKIFFLWNIDSNYQ